MYFPTTIIDNFYDNFEEIKNHSEKLDYFDRSYFNKRPTMPGKITNELHEINKDFFIKCSKKVMSIFYNRNDINFLQYECKTRFEKIIPYNLNYIKKGFIHSDDNNMLTGLLYIQGDKDEGTSLFKIKNINKENITNFKIKEDVYSGIKIDPSIYNDSLNRHNENYEEILNVPLIPNRLTLFDSSLYHASNGYGSLDKPRIMQTFFFTNIRSNYYPIPELRRNHI